MKLFFTIMAIMCYSVVNTAAEDNYEVKSLCCEKLDYSEDLKLCEHFDFWVWKELCEYNCDEGGELRVFNCNSVFHFESVLALCKDLRCEIINETTVEPRGIAHANFITPPK